MASGDFKAVQRPSAGTDARKKLEKTWNWDYLENLEEKLEEKQAENEEETLEKMLENTVV